MINEYATIVFPSGKVIQFRCNGNRFKIRFDGKWAMKLHVEFMKEYPTIDYDDCSGEEFAIFVQYLIRTA